MNITTKEVKLHYLTPEEGCYLTQSTDVPNEKRIFSEGVWLANKGKESEWKNITQEEADAIKAEQERLAQEEMNKNA
jgi:hypothetical protein